MNTTTRRSWVATRLRAQGIEPLRFILTRQLFTEVWPKSFRATTVLIPEVVFWLMTCVVFGDGTMAGCISSFWSTLMPLYSMLPLEPVSDAAFCMARTRLPVEFFRKLFSTLQQRFAGTFGDRFRWRGKRLLGLDGSELNLPAGAPELVEAFGRPSNKQGAAKHPQGLLVGFVDLFSGTCTAFGLAGMKEVKRKGKMLTKREGEHDVAHRLLEQVGKDDLIMGDRNFPGFRLIAAILSRGADLHIRLPKDRFTLEKYPRTALKRPDEWLVTLELPAKVREEFPELGPCVTLRVLRYQLPGFRPSHLITSLLDDQLYSYDDLVLLYHERWRHETAHREWKHTLELANLRSHTPDGILKEVYTQLTLNNALRWVQAEATTSPLRPVDLQFKACKRLLQAAIPAMALVATPAELKLRFERLKKEMAKRRIRVRPGRSYSRRKNETRGKDKGHGRIVEAARLPHQVPSIPMAYGV